MADIERKKARPQSQEKDDETESVLDKGSVENESENLDSLLDEIDSVLEENAEEFVKGYIQKGGE